MTRHLLASLLLLTAALTAAYSYPAAAHPTSDVSDMSDVSDVSDASQQSPNPLDLDIDQNIVTPAVPRKAVKPLQEHMVALARRLQKDGIPNASITSLRDGQVLKVTFLAEDFFAPNDTVVRQEAHKLLSPLVRYMRRPSMYKMLMAVHSDDTGEALYSDHLTQARAEALDIYVERIMGINPSPLIPYAMGREDPTDTNDTRAGRRLNRRVEFYLIPLQQLIKNPTVLP